MKLRFGLLCLIAIVGLGCTARSITLPDSESSAAQLYSDKCSACHALPHPKRHSAAEWPPVFKLMERRMRERHVPAFSAEQRSVLLGYLQDNAR
ncbi:MAG: hypothetical protein KUG82_18105 [Pseudomonadales bacterium]|nr:hypothetical protein [Pseudomonadales bacterium]